MCARKKMEGIILKTQDFKETHKIVTIFSKRIGKFSAIARGAKKNQRVECCCYAAIHLW